MSRISLRAPVALGLAVIVVLPGFFGLWAATTRIAGAVLVPGIVEATGGHRTVAHPEGGRVAAVVVRPGDRVRTGQIVLELDPAPLLAERDLIETELGETLIRRARAEAEAGGQGELPQPTGVAALLARHTGLARLIASERDLLDARQASRAAALSRQAELVRRHAARIAGLGERRAGLSRELALLREDLAALVALSARGLAEAPARRALEREEARLVTALAELAAAIADERAAQRAAQAEAERLTRLWREEALAEVAALAGREGELAIRLAGINRRLVGTTLRAPVTGVVHAVATQGPGGVLPAGAPAVVIVPTGSAPVVMARVPPSDAGEVRKGQSATLRLASSDMMDELTLTGRVTNLSPDAFTDPATGARFFRAEITVEPGGGIGRAPSGMLAPGLPVEVLILKEERAPLSILAEPFAGFLARALR